MDWFTVDVRVTNWCLISPLPFSLYLNELMQIIKDKGLGINIDGNLVSTLLYADDISLIASKC